MKYVCALIIVLFAFAACEKDEVEVVELEYPSTYHSVRYENVASVRLFTKNGEIHDPTIISRFVKRFGTNYLYPDGISVPTAQLTVNPFDTVQIVSPSLALVKMTNSFKEYNLKRYKNEIEFTSVDTVTILVPNIEDYLLGVDVGIHKPAYIDSVKPYGNNHPPSGASFKMEYKGFLKKYAAVTPQQLVFPLINYVITHSVLGYRLPDGTPIYTNSAQSIRNYNDKFDPFAYRQLYERDTLAIQEFRVIYER